MDVWDRLRQLLPEGEALVLEAELKARAQAEDTTTVAWMLHVRRGRVLSARVCGVAVVPAVILTRDDG